MDHVQTPGVMLRQVIQTKTKLCIVCWQVPAVYGELEGLSTASYDLTMHTA